LIVAGAAIWIAAFQFESLYESPALRVSLVSTILAAHALLSARELWHARDRELISRWPTLALVVTHAGFLLARIPFASVVASSAAAGQPHSAVVLVMAAEALLVNFCLPFLRVAMSKERAELEQRRAALTDSLTGVANRRAFFDLGERLLARIIADRRPAALLLFDLDRFKEVNDTAGRPAAGVRAPRRRFGASGRPVQPRRRRGIRLPLAERLDGGGAADRRAIARGFRADALSGRGALRHRERRRRHDDRRMPDPAGPDGDRRSGALSRQGRRAQPRRPGAAGGA
jgi:predicted signal transduction protein with EAL and GGDEF domain